MEPEDVEEMHKSSEKVMRYNKKQKKEGLKGAAAGEKDVPLTITEGQLHRLKKTIEQDYYKLCTGKERDGGGSAYYNPYKSADFEKCDGKIQVDFKEEGFYPTGP